MDGGAETGIFTELKEGAGMKGAFVMIDGDLDAVFKGGGEADGEHGAA